MGRRKTIEELEQYLTEAVDNIRDDRAVVSSLLIDLMGYMKKDQSAHKECGVVAAKYVETLQRSNEQLVKVSSLLQKRETPAAGLSPEDKSDLYDVINSRKQDDDV